MPNRVPEGTVLIQFWKSYGHEFCSQIRSNSGCRNLIFQCLCYYKALLKEYCCLQKVCTPWVGLFISARNLPVDNHTVYTPTLYYLCTPHYAWKVMVIPVDSLGALRIFLQYHSLKTVVSKPIGNITTGQVQFPTVATWIIELDQCRPRIRDLDRIWELWYKILWYIYVEENRGKYKGDFDTEIFSSEILEDLFS